MASLTVFHASNYKPNAGEMLPVYNVEGKPFEKAIKHNIIVLFLSLLLLCCAFLAQSAESILFYN